MSGAHQPSRLASRMSKRLGGLFDVIGTPISRSERRSCVATTGSPRRAAAAQADKLGARVARSSSMQRYDYKQLCVDAAEMGMSAFSDQLTSFGRDGWQLITTVQRERHGYSHEVRLLFVRPVDGAGS